MAAGDDPQEQRARRLVVLGIGSALALCLVGAVWSAPCLPMRVRYGLSVGRCDVTPQLEASLRAPAVRRGEAMPVYVHATARWEDDVRYGVRHGEVSRGLEVSFAVKVAGAEPFALAHEVRDGAYWITLPTDLADGDHALLATVSTGFASVTVEAVLPVYARAIGQVLLDRPLVRPGETVAARSVTLRASDRTPVAKRAGVWTLRSPNGEVVWTERAETDAWGVSDVRLSLDGAAEPGTWTVRWTSGALQADVPVRVEHFVLPPLVVAVGADAGWRGPGEALRLVGSVVAPDGRPVAAAPVRVTLRAEGTWPLPLAWQSPITATTAADGRFQVDLGTVPKDLSDRTRVVIEAVATAPGGETVSAAGAVVLSPESLDVRALTEMGGRLAEGRNNRLWLRVLTPDGAVVADTDVSLRLPGQGDRVVAARTDADGVLTAQIDPGRPVTVVRPPVPVRARPPRIEPAALIRLQSEDPSPRATDQAAIQAWVADGLGRCAGLPGPVQVSARIGPDGRVQRVRADGSYAGACVTESLAAVRFQPGAWRTWTMEVRPPGSAYEVDWRAAGSQAIPDSAAVRFVQAAQRCAEAAGLDASVSASVAWAIDDEVVQVDAVDGDPRVASCLRLPPFPLAAADTFGTATVEVRPRDPRGEEAAPQPRTSVGYEIVVEVGERSGSVVLEPGEPPPLRVRVDPLVVDPGAEVAVELLRGPGGPSRLPTKVRLVQAGRDLAEVEFPRGERATTLKVPADARGLVEVAAGGVRANVLVRDPSALEVVVGSDAGMFAPGADATLTVSTSRGGVGVPASVGLVGVDQRLGQLVTLPGPSALAEAAFPVPTSQPAFDAFTATDLLLGRITGPSAQAAALVGVGALPAEDRLDEVVSVSADVTVDPQPVLLASFWRARGAVVAEVRRWEGDAPAGELLTPEQVAAWWVAVRDRLADEGKPVVDAWGRPLHLNLLPDDLLALLSPRALVRDGARLSEDEVDWASLARRVDAW